MRQECRQPLLQISASNFEDHACHGLLDLQNLHVDCVDCEGVPVVVDFILEPEGCLDLNAVTESRVGNQMD